MKRLVLAAALAAAAVLPATSASANPLGYCDDPADVVCREYPCVPDLPCTIQFCIVWALGDCVVG